MMKEKVYQSDDSRPTDNGDTDSGEDISYHDKLFEVMMGICVEKC